MSGIRYPGDDRSEPEDVRERKAMGYARRVERLCAKHPLVEACEESDRKFTFWFAILVVAVFATVMIYFMDDIRAYVRDIQDLIVGPTRSSI